MSLTDPNAVESILHRLHGVIAARVEYEGTNKVAGVEVVASRRRSPMQVVADVRSLLFARFGVDLPEDRIQVSFLSRGDGLGRIKKRWRIFSIRQTNAAHMYRVQVVLTEGGKRVSGEADGRSLPADILNPQAAARQVLRPVAEATLRAVEQTLATGVRFSLGDVRIVDLTAVPVVLVAANIYSGQADEPLLGVSLLRDDPLMAAARAAMDATNRRVSLVESLQFGPRANLDSNYA